MSKAIVLHNLAELAGYFPVDLPQVAATDDGNASEVATAPPIALAAADAEMDAPPADLDSVLALIAGAQATLAGLTEQDHDARQAAHGLLERYEALSSEFREAEAVWSRAQEVCQAVEALATTAFAETARTAASNLLPLVQHAEASAARLVEQRRAGLDRLALDPALQRLLEERRREQERQEAAAEDADRARRLREGLAGVQAALAAGHLQEAQAMLGDLAKDHPDSAEVTSLTSMIHHRLVAVKVDAVEETLRQARRDYRQAPADALRRLEQVDLQGLPESLLQQLKGVWAAACARVCKERQAAAFLRYLPQPAYGVVVAREAAGEYRVVSALGPSTFRVGAPVDEAFVRRAHPLRASGR